MSVNQLPVAIGSYFSSDGSLDLGALFLLSFEDRGGVAGEVLDAREGRLVGGPGGPVGEMVFCGGHLGL